MTFDPSPHTVFVGLGGSRAHGTALPSSDVDVRGVCIVPLAVRVSLFSRFEQLDGPIPVMLHDRLRSALAARALDDMPVEGAVFEVQKLLSLAAVQNPSALELLFTDERDWLLETPAWRRLHAARYTFLTRHVEVTFLGYAREQLRRIETHRGFLLSPPKGAPTRAEFGLPEASTLSADDRDRLEAALTRFAEDHGIAGLELAPEVRADLRDRLDALLASALAVPEGELDARMRAIASHALALPVAVVQALNGERRYRAALRSWQAYEAWRHGRNPLRAELERRHGYDTKHGAHLVRLLRMGIEVLETGEVVVRRPDADELVAIREGALSYEALSEQVAQLRGRMAEAARTTRLSATCGLDAVERLHLALVEGAG